MKLGTIIAVFMAMVCMVDPIEAQDFGGSFGVAYWKPDWDLSQAEGTTNGIWGPTAMLRYKDISFSIQYFTGEYDINFESLPDTYAADRTDLDLGVSFRFLKYFNATAGYKMIKFDWNTTYRLDATIQGFALGIGAAYTFPSNMLIYGSGSYLPALEYEWDFGGVTESYDGTGMTLDGGFGYVFQPINFVLKAGYRYQKFDADDAQAEGVEETNKGFRAELSYLF
jgi:hypothetical protein